MNDDALIEALANKWSVPHDDLEGRYEELREEHVKLQKQFLHFSEEREEMFSLVNKFFKNKVRFDTQDDRDKYMEAREDLRHYMMDQGWCFTCSQLYCDGHDD